MPTAWWLQPESRRKAATLGRGAMIASANRNAVASVFAAIRSLVQATKRNPFRVGHRRRPGPNVAAARQRWAGGWNRLRGFFLSATIRTGK